MKRILIFSIICCLLLLVGCNKDKKEPVPQVSSLSIQFVDVPDQYAVFDTIHYSIVATMPSGLNAASASVFINQSIQETSFTAGLDSARTAIGDTLSFILGPDEIAQVISFSFSITDLSGVTLSDTISTVVAESDISYFYGAQLAGFNNSLEIGSFYDILGDTTYFANSIRNKANVIRTIDLVYCYDQTAKRSLASPNDSWIDSIVWVSQNATFWPLGSFENETTLYDLGESTAFEGIVSVGQIRDLIEAETEVDSVTFIALNRVIGFRLDSLRGGNVGIMKVVATSGNSVTTGTLTLDLKVQK